MSLENNPDSDFYQRNRNLYGCLSDMPTKKKNSSLSKRTHQWRLMSRVLFIFFRSFSQTLTLIQSNSCLTLPASENVDMPFILEDSIPNLKQLENILVTKGRPPRGKARAKYRMLMSWGVWCGCHLLSYCNCS